MITTWYLQSQRTWDKLCHSCIGSSFLPRGAFPEGRAYAFPQRLHAGSLEALRVSRPEAVVLAINNFLERGCANDFRASVGLSTTYGISIFVWFLALCRVVVSNCSRAPACTWSSGSKRRRGR